METDQINRILDRICTKLGICFPLAELESLVNYEFIEAKDLADEMCKSEGLDPIMVDRGLSRQILEEIRNEIPLMNPFQF